MGIDKQKFNAVYNQLKEMVGDHGAFIIMATTPTEGCGEDMKFETFGSITTLNGLMGIGNLYLQGAMKQKLDTVLRPAPRQPD